MEKIISLWRHVKTFVSLPHPQINALFCRFFGIHYSEVVNTVLARQRQNEVCQEPIFGYGIETNFCHSVERSVVSLEFQNPS